MDNYFTKYSMTGRSNHIDSMQYYRNGADGVIAITTDKLYPGEAAHEEWISLSELCQSA